MFERIIKIIKPKLTAKAFLEMLVPDCASHMRAVKSSDSGLYSKSYIYNFVRYENYDKKLVKFLKILSTVLKLTFGDIYDII